MPASMPADRLAQSVADLAQQMIDANEEARVLLTSYEMLISEAREGNNLDAWMSLANRARCGNAVHLRQHQVHQRHIWLNSRTQLHRFFACLSLTRQLEIVGCVQEGHQPTAHHFVVVCYENTYRFHLYKNTAKFANCLLILFRHSGAFNGTIISTVVPLPGTECTTHLAFIEAA